MFPFDRVTAQLIAISLKWFKEFSPCLVQRFGKQSLKMQLRGRVRILCILLEHNLLKAVICQIHSLLFIQLVLEIRLTNFGVYFSPDLKFMYI